MRSHLHRGVVSAQALVYVAGAVFRPGVYRLAPGSRVGDAIARAGGLRPDADPVAVNLAAHVADGDEIAVARVGETIRATGKRTQTRRAKTRSLNNPPSPVALNAANAETLAGVPGIGPTIAARIVSIRNAEGAFTNYDELLDVAGMTAARLDRARPYLTI